MSFTLDHIVVVVADLDRTIADWRDLGFTVLPGGEHTNRASHNALVVLADGAYFELIAYRAPLPSNRWWRRLDQAGEGFVDFALLPSAIADDVAQARARGLELDGPHDGGRLRPDGVRLDWQVVRPTTHDLPFWCADVTPRELRVPEGDDRRHANGALGVAAIRVVVADLARSAERWRALLGADAVRAIDGSLTLDLGRTRIDLVDGRDPAAAARLAQAGEGVWQVTLAGRDDRHLDIARTHGAAVSIAAA